MQRRGQIQCEVEGHGARFMRVANVLTQVMLSGALSTTVILYDYVCIQCEANKAAQTERDDANSDLI